MEFKTIPTSAEDRHRYYAARAWRDTTPVADLDRWSRAKPAADAIVTLDATGTVQSRLTFAELHRNVDVIAYRLVRLGVQPGDVVSFQLPNWWQFTAINLACDRIGAVANPILPIHRRRTVEYVVRQLKCPVLFVPAVYRDFDYLGMAEKIAESVPSLRHVISVGADTQASAEHLERDLLAEPDAGDMARVLAGLPRPNPDSIAAIKHTSGTTGSPKGVLHTHNTLYATTRAVPDLFGLGEQSRIFMASPLVHMSGYLYGVLMPVIYGMTAVYLDRWSGRGMAAAIDAERCVWTMGPTPYVIDFLDAVAAGSYDTTTFTYFACSGAPIPRYLGARCEAAGFHLFPVWGMTETGSATFVGPRTPPDSATSTDGLPSPFMECAVVDESGRPLGPDTSGELLVRGASRFVGYANDDDRTREAVTSDGWLHTGDIAQIDSRGYVTIGGRKKDLIVRGGENIPVGEVEGLLARHPKVREAALIAYPDRRLGERAMAIVVPRDKENPTLPELLEFLLDQGLSKYFLPERLVLAEALPYTESGKVRKQLLREQYATAD